MLKINNPGLRLRRKSNVHGSIISDISGRRFVTGTRSTENVVSNKREKWTLNGEKDLKLMYIFRLDVTKLRELKRPVDIMILGPGEGAEVNDIKKTFKSIKRKIDTLGIINNLTTTAKKKIRKDYSPDPETLSEKDLFEHFNHLKFVRKYDYIYSAYGPVKHTKFPEVAILKIASMLRPGGFARIRPDVEPEVIERCLEYLTQTKSSNQIDLSFDKSYDNNYLIIRRLK
ncbi:MAG: hypothetical protein WCX82_00845 [archaeon]|jgi:hypothetical protein